MIGPPFDILVFITWSGAAAVVTWLAAARARIGGMLSLVALAGCLYIAAQLADTRTSHLGATLLEQGPYLRVWLAIASASLVAVHVVGLVSGDAWRGGPPMLLGLAATAAALGSNDPLVALLVLGGASFAVAGAARADASAPRRVAAAAAPHGSHASHDRRHQAVPTPVAHSDDGDSGAPALGRAAALSIVLGLAAAALATVVATPGHQLYLDSRTVNASLLLAVGAVAVRAGGLPLASLGRSVAAVAPRPSAAAAWAWLPAATLLVLVAVAARSLTRTGGDLDTTARTIQIAAMLALLAAAAVAILARNAAHILGSAVVANGSLALLALVPAAVAPGGVRSGFPVVSGDAARVVALWLPLFAVFTSWTVAWLVVAATGRTTLRLPEFRGWARGRPLLALALIAGTALGYGWPGTVPWDTRVALIDRLAAGQVRDTALAVSVVPLLGVLRLLFAGVRRAPETSLAAPRDWPPVRRGLRWVPVVVRRAPLASLLVLLLAFGPVGLTRRVTDVPGIANAWTPAHLTGGGPASR